MTRARAAQSLIPIVVRQKYGSCLFVFLDLLKGNTQAGREFFLAHIQHEAAHADARANVAINGVMFGSGHILSVFLLLATEK